MLSAKYSELVIDEAQDCSAADLHILTQLLDADLPLVLVADPDQAIYGFRGACTADLARLANRLGRQDLTHNWRSTAVICALTATLRTDPARRAPDIAVADHCDAAVPVLVYGSDDRDWATADFIAYADTIGIRQEDCLVLAHARAGLPRAYSGGAAPPQPKAAALGWAVGIITEYPAAPFVTRNRAHDILARTALRWWYADADGQTVAECLAAHNIDPAAFERLLHRVVTAMPSLDQPMSTWVPAASAALSRHPPFAGAARSRNRLTAAGQGSRRARTVAGLPSATATGTGTRLSTIHQAKGDEADAVLLHMPAGPLSDRSLSAWLDGRSADAETAEAMRVLYVGLTRARKLLGISVPVTHRARLVAHLHGHHIPAAMR
jgi:DNA helicase II / ATP-dependent DNA helicase PcrA